MGKAGSWWLGEEGRAPLDPDLTTSLINAAERGQIQRRSPHEQLLHDLMQRYPFRVRRILSDMAWLEKKARKRGISFK